MTIDWPNKPMTKADILFDDITGFDPKLDKRRREIALALLNLTTEERSGTPDYTLIVCRNTRVEPDIDPESKDPEVPQYVFPFFNDTPSA